MRSIAVIGGGPAGGAAALGLARGGARVDLYVPSRPGEKPCGGAVPEAALPPLEGFEGGKLRRVSEPPTLIENDRGSRIEIRLAGIEIFRRRDFDAALVSAAERAGAVVQRQKVEHIEPNERGVRVRSREIDRSYDWVVGADGARGLTRRTVGLQSAGESIGLGASLSGLEVENLVLSFLGLADSYAWVFPRPGGASVGVAYTSGTVSDDSVRIALASFLDRTLPPGWRQLPGPRYRYPIPVFGPATVPGLRKALLSRILLVGDAASLADPLTREGIRYGLLSGSWAADCLLAEAPGTYPDVIAARLGLEMEYALKARDLFFAGSVGRWMVPVSRLHRGVRIVLQDLLACRQSYSGLTMRLARAAFNPG
jgi:flavin-dependent dehydrogenase